MELQFEIGDWQNALLSDSLLRDIKVLSSNAKGDADILETELRAVINAMSQNEGKSVDALKNSTASLKQSNQIKRATRQNYTLISYILSEQNYISIANIPKLHIRYIIDSFL